MAVRAAVVFGGRIRIRSVVHCPGRRALRFHQDVHSRVLALNYFAASRVAPDARHGPSESATPHRLLFCATFLFGSVAKRMPPTKVQIYGQTYSIAGDLDPAYVQKLAAYVDEKMRVISDATTTVDTQKAAVLAALAIADELHSGLRERTEEEELLREQAERCLTLVERALKQTA